MARNAITTSPPGRRTLTAPETAPPSARELNAFISALTLKAAGADLRGVSGERYDIEAVNPRVKRLLNTPMTRSLFFNVFTEPRLTAGMTELGAKYLRMTPSLRFRKGETFGDALGRYQEETEALLRVAQARFQMYEEVWQGLHGPAHEMGMASLQGQQAMAQQDAAHMQSLEQT